MKEPTVGAILLAASLFITLALIGIGVAVYSSSSDSAKTATTEFSNTTTEVKDQKYLIYDNTTVSGSQVVNAIRKFKNEGESGDIAIYVQTGKNPSGKWYYNSFNETNGIIKGSSTNNPDNINDSASSEYINPTGQFQASVHRDSNSVIRAIKFVQK